MASIKSSVFDPYDGVAAVRRILGSRCTPRRKLALLLVLEGMSYRKAEALTGGHHDVCLFRNAKRLGLQALHNHRRREREAWACTPAEAAAIDCTLAGTATPAQALIATEKALWAAERLSEAMRGGIEG